MQLALFQNQIPRAKSVSRINSSNEDGRKYNTEFACNNNSPDDINRTTAGFRPASHFPTVVVAGKTFYLLSEI
jgi:hypothetical protein